MNTENNNQETSTNEDVLAAFKSLESGNPAPAPAAPAPAAPAPSGEGVPAQPVPGNNRGPDGRFVSAGTGDGAAPAQGAAPVQGNGQAQPPAPQGGDGNAPPVPAQSGSPADAGLKLDPAKPPSGWSAPMKEKWNTIPEDVRQEIIRREEAGIAGVQRLRQQHEPAEKVYEALRPHENYFKHIDTTPQDYIQNVMRVEQTLTLGNPAQKMETLLQLADDYGVPLRQTLDAAMGGQLMAVLQQGHQHFKSPPTLPPEVARELEEARRFREQLANQAIEAELKTISDNPDKYPLFDEAREKMADLLEAGMVKTYDEAYQFAVWQNPEWRAKTQAIANGQAQATALQQRQQAAGSLAAPAPGAAGGGQAPTPPEDESTEDTVRRMFLAAQKPAGTV